MIREAIVDDAAAIARIHVAVWRVAYDGVVPDEHLRGLSEEKKIAFWQRELSEKRAIVFVAIERDGIVGWIAGGKSRDADGAGDIELYAIYILPEYWRHGIGRELMKSLIESLPNSSRMTLWVLRENLTAIRFYKKLGFEEDGATKELMISGKRLIEVRMRRLLKYPQ